MVLRFLRLAIVAALLVAPSAHAQDAPEAPAGDDVVIPNFWDLRARLERPAPGTIGAIRFLVTDDFAPFSFRDRRGQLIGFDIDLAEAICEVLDVSCAIQIRPFDTLVEGLEDGTGNAILAGFDPQRAAENDFLATRAYLKIPGRFVARTGSGFDPDRTAAPVSSPSSTASTAASTDAAERPRVGVACGSAHQAYLGRFFPRLRAAPCYPSTAEALAALEAGEVTAVFGDAVGLSFWLHGEASGDCCAFAGGPYVDDRYFGPGLAIVLRREDRALKTALDYALREVYRTGKYQELYLRYFPVGLF